jgi:phosphoribosylaminoimidazolecarboxamide formyltransferase/IMP cyclohydrolase
MWYSVAMADAEFPEELELRLKRSSLLRYGENPHQKAALYIDERHSAPSIARATMLQGKELSCNNIMDADAAFQCVAEFDEPAVVIVKHMNPCGVAIAENAEFAYEKALACDPVSAFGGIVALNSELTGKLASKLVDIFLEVVVAPSVQEEALAILATKPNLRVLITGSMPDKHQSLVTVRSIAGGMLVSSSDNQVFDGDVRTVTKRAPSAEELADLLFAFTVCKHVKSNAIVYAKGGATVGIGAGQMSRIYSAKIAALKAQEAKLSLKGAVMASDAFFPFPDCVEAAHEVGATAIIQPGGSIKDKDSIDKCDEAGMAMVFTGMRHFRH